MASCIFQRFTDVKKETIQMQDQNSDEKPKINRLKRANRTKKPDLLSSECEVIRPDSDDDDQKCSHTSTMKNTGPPDSHGSPCSPTKRGLLANMETSQGQNQHEIKSRTSCHQQPSVHADEAGRLTESGTGGSELHGHKLSHRVRSSSGFIKDAHTQEEILKQVQAQNPRFPVQRVFQTLLKRLGESENALVVPVTGKRKQEVESHSIGCLRKRTRSSQDGSETQNTSECHVSTGHEKISRNRLRRKPAPVQDAIMDDSPQDERYARHDHDAEHDHDLEHEDDVPWTEKFRPRSCDEVIGNSAAVRKLYSWLKEWRIRADVEERRKRREERRIKKESNGSWDCGDFEGDPLTEECEGELCNTLLIHGPTGAGKSAAVFACAEQLGFKVLEVNSSSLRSGRLVLSQLRESTQSHQVGAPQRSVSQAEAPAQKSVSACRKPPSAAASRKKSAAAQTSGTLTRSFRKTAKLVNKHSGNSQGTRAGDEVTLDESGFTKDDALDKKGKTAPISLILFEEVDIIFEEDVGFLAAVKSLMNTTKRPIVLTTNDPAFGQCFGGRFEEIRFKTPAMASVVSYLQCVCVVQSVKPELEHIRFMLQENNRDVRRSVFELELWARSGAGNTHHHLHTRALACSSYAELESSRCVEVLVDCWRKGRSLLHSYLDLLLAPPTVIKAHQSTSNENTIFSSRNRSGLKVKKNHLKTKRSGSSVSLDSFQQTSQSASAAGSVSQVDSVARFFDMVSFVESHLSPRPFCKPGPLGAKGADGSLDEPRDEDEEELNTHRLERCYEIQAVVEGLGFYRCRMEVCPIKRGDRDMTGGDTAPTLREERISEALQRVLHSEAFRYHRARAMLTDYLPCLRFICSEQRAEQQPRLRFSHYLTEIGLRLPKSVLDLLASPLH